MNGHALTRWLGLVCLLGACDPRGLGRPNPNFLVIGHRGAPNEAAENTIPSFKVAIAVGANAIETDVCITSDGIFVVWHDRDPDSIEAIARQSGAEGLAYIPIVPPIGSALRRPVDQLTLEELRQNYGYGSLDGTRADIYQIPTLTEALQWARDEAALKAVYIDTKLTETQPVQATALFDAIHAAKTADDSLAGVSFFMLSVHRNIVDTYEAERIALGERQMRVAWDYEGTGALQGTLDAHLRDISAGLVPSVSWSDFKRDVAHDVDAREAGQIDSVTVWTFDRDMQLAELLYYSVDGIMTNRPESLYRIWQDTLD